MLAQEALRPHAATKVLHFADASSVFRGFADDQRQAAFEVHRSNACGLHIRLFIPATMAHGDDRFIYNIVADHDVPRASAYCSKNVSTFHGALGLGLLLNAPNAQLVQEAISYKL